MKQQTNYTTLSAALLLATVSGYFAVTGMASLYAGSATAVSVIFIAIEIGKLANANFLHANWHRLAVPLRTALAALLVAAMALTSAGVYSALTHAFMEQAPARAADVERAKVLQDQVADFDRQIEALDRNTDAATLVNTVAARGKVEAAKDIAAEARRDRRNDRADLVAKRTAAADQLAAVRVRLAAHQVELGPATSLAALAGLKPEDAIQALTLVVTLCLDPLAVFLVMAAGSRAEEEAPMPDRQMPLVQAPVPVPVEQAAPAKPATPAKSKRKNRKALGPLANPAENVVALRR
jgi:hypothetical protein